MSRLRRCNRNGKVIFDTELEAKIVLARRVWKDAGEKRPYPCPGMGHWHLTSIPLSSGSIAPAD